MAVTTIRKVSSFTLLAMSGVSVAIILLFFFGGTEMVTVGNATHESYVWTDALLYWMYLLFGATILATVCFALKGLIDSFRTDSKAALQSIAGVLAFVALLVVTYMIGDDTPVQVNADAQKFNTPGWLKSTDMWLYSSYILIALSTIAALWGAISKNLLKR